MKEEIILLTPEEAAKYLGVLPLTLATWRSKKTHNLPYIKIGRLVKYKKSDLDNWINQRTIKN